MKKGVMGVLAIGALSFATTLADDYMYVSATHLNVRASATYRSAIVTTVDSGYKVTILESHDNGWKKVLLENGQEGYMNGRYLTTTEPYFEKALGSNYQVAVPAAYIRGEGFKKIVAVLHNGDRIEVLDEKVFLGRWLRVRVVSSTHDRYNERTGYISKKLVRVDESTLYTESMNMTSDDTISDEVTDPTESDTSTTDDTDTLNDLGLSSSNSSAPTTTAPEATTAPETKSTNDSEDIGDLLGGLLK